MLCLIELLKNKAGMSFGVSKRKNQAKEEVRGKYVQGEGKDSGNLEFLLGKGSKNHSFFYIIRI